jgi:hypothetical protein
MLTTKKIYPLATAFMIAVLGSINLFSVELRQENMSAQNSSYACTNSTTLIVQDTSSLSLKKQASGSTIIEWLKMAFAKFGCACLIQSSMQSGPLFYNSLSPANVSYTELVQCSRCLSDFSECPEY